MPFLLILGDMEEPTTVEGFPFGDLLLRSGDRLNPLNEVVRKWRRVLGANRRMKQTTYVQGYAHTHTGKPNTSAK